VRGGWASAACWRGRDRALASPAEGPALPGCGDVVFVDRAASVQFTASAGFAFRVIRVDDGPTCEGWRWIEGYQLGPGGVAVERRRIFVQLAGLRPLQPGRADEHG